MVSSETYSITLILKCQEKIIHRVFFLKIKKMSLISI